MGRIARKSMRHFNNDLVLKKWIKLILSINNGDYFYNSLREEDEVLSQIKFPFIIKNQIELLKKRIPIFKNISNNEFENFTFMENAIV